MSARRFLLRAGATVLVAATVALRFAVHGLGLYLALALPLIPAAGLLAYLDARTRR